MSTQHLINQWMNAYQSNPLHTLKDTNHNLKGFKAAMRGALTNHSVDYAFKRAIEGVICNRLEG